MKKEYETFVVSLQKRSKYWEMNLTYDVPVEKLTQIIDFLEPYRKPKKTKDDII